MNLWGHLGERRPPLVELFDPLPQIDVERGNTALLVVDMDHGSTTPGSGLIAYGEARGISMAYYQDRLAKIVPNNARLLKAFRDAGLEVAFTKGRGTKGGHKLGGYPVRPLIAGSGDATAGAGREIRADLAPHEGDLVIEKDTPGPFGVTNIDHALRSLGITRLVMTGIVTDQCVEATVRGAFDFGYQVILVEDACGTVTEELHRSSLRVMADWFCRVATTAEIVDLVSTGANGTEQHE